MPPIRSKSGPGLSHAAQLAAGRRHCRYDQNRARTTKQSATDGQRPEEVVVEVLARLFLSAFQLSEAS